MVAAQRVGGAVLFQAMGIVIMLASLGSALTGGLGAAKLLFAMGRDGVLPRKVFAHVHPVTKTPTYSILLIGVFAYAGAIVLSRQA